MSQKPSNANFKDSADKGNDANGINISQLRKTNPVSTILSVLQSLTHKE